VKVAFVIAAHHRPRQLTRLARRLAVPGAGVFVHVDRAAPDSIWREAAGKLGAMPHTVLLPRRHSRWGTFDLVETTLSGLAAALRHGTDFENFTVLTGQDYPIKAPIHFCSFLEQHRELSFIPHFRLRPGPWVDGGGIERLQRWHFRLGQQRIAFPNRYLPIPLRRRMPRGLQPFGGSAYWSLSRECAEYVVEFSTARPDVSRFFRRVFAPDEAFYQSILASSHLADRLIDDDLRFIRWRPGSRHPKVLTLEDFSEIAQSPGFFARKFDDEVDAAVLDRIDQRLLGMAAGNVPAGSGGRWES
jgi:Core-2/I-Branching enzyme